MVVTLASEYWGQDAAGQLNTSEGSRYYIFRSVHIHIEKQNNILSSYFYCTFLRHKFFLVGWEGDI